MTTWLILGVAIGLGCFALAMHRHRRQSAETRLNERELLDDDEIYRRFYAGSGLPREIVLELWNEIASVLQVAPGHLRPSDAFGKDIGAYWMISDDLDVLAIRAEKRAKRLNVEVDLKSVKTVDDYVHRFAQPPPG